MICSINSGTCLCPYLTYWNGTYCANQLTYLDDCDKNDSCNYVEQNLKCNKYNSDTNKCLCDSETEYWNSTEYKCKSKLSFGGYCNTTQSACLNSNNNLYCLKNVCNCTADYYWSSLNKKCCN